LISEQKTYLDNINVKHLVKIDNESFAFTSDTFFQIFDIKNKTLTQKINEHSKEITKIIILKNGKLVTGSKDAQIRIWNIAENKNISLIGLLTDHGEEIVELIELSNGFLLSGDIKGKIIIYDINKFKQIKSFFIYSTLIGVFETGLNEFFIATEKSLGIYHNNKKCILKNFEDNKIICSLFINLQIICSKNNNYINIYNIDPFSLQKSLLINANMISIKQFSNKYFCGISSEYTLHFFNLINYEQLFCINVKTYNFYEFLIINDSFVYSGSNNGLTEWSINLSSLIDKLVDNIVLV
jgi:WD40 repeat protein